MDTAGIRNAVDMVEALGVERSRRAVADAECIVAVFDRSSVHRGRGRARRGNGAEQAGGRGLEQGRSNARDLVRRCGRHWPIRRLTVEVSALTGVGLGELSARIGDLLFGSGENVPDDEAVIFRTRHRDAARRAKADVSRAEEALVNGSPLEIVACDLAAAAAALAEITGEITSEDVLDKVFADFCLGK